MTAQFTHAGTTHHCSIGLQQRDDGTVGPPYQLHLTERACASAEVAAWDLELDHVDPELDLAVYRVVRRNCDMEPAVAEPAEKVLIPLESIAWALLVVRSAHRLLNAVLDDKPKATIIRELAVELEKFVVKSMTLQHLDTDADSVDEVFDMLTAPRHYVTRLIDGNLVVEPGGEAS